MDRGLTWVVCGAAFVTQMLTVGFIAAIGVYYVEFLSVFEESKAKTAWVSSLNYGALSVIGKFQQKKLTVNCITSNYR